MHGYQLIEKMEAKGYVRPGRFKTGSIYTILSRMERRGFLSSKQEKSVSGRTVRTYNVTNLGRKTLKTGLEHILLQKKLIDDLAKYYAKHFQNDAPDNHKTR